MPQIEPSVLTALMKAAKDAPFHTSTAFALRAADVGSRAAAEQRDALVAALRLRPSEGTKSRKEAQAGLPSQPAPAQLEIWNLYADGVSDPLLRGHLHHLLLDAGHGRTYDHICGAATGYLDAAQLLLATPREGHGLSRAARCLTRARELARRFNQPLLRDRATTDALALAERILDGDEDEGRALLGLLEELRGPRGDAAVLADLAERAAERFAHDVDDRLGFLELLRESAPPSRRTEIDTAVVHTLLDAADVADAGHRRLYYLTEAATEAQKRGLSELRVRAVMALQQTTLEWTVIRSEGTLPRALVAGQRALVDAAPDLQTALWRTVEDIHPAMRTQAQAEADGALEGLLRLPRSRINPAGPVFVRPPVDADDDHAVQMQVDGLGVFGRLTAVQLDRIHERFRPDEFEMIGALAHETVLPEPRARILARAFLYYWLGEFEAAACVALPQVEQILRELLRTRVSIVSVAKGQTPGGVAMLGGLLQSMPEAGYPADWSRALELLLVDSDRGMNLRNDILHGLTGTPPRHHVALILQAALYLLSHAHGQRAAPRTTA
ncbi:hypothetical protein ACFV0O_28800 [Kitasatospora sp. NPDC059577]|uniref:hypothetical protein n=1 Tax=Kitasatospora sp. NPDC059577 TaxID=3346873 RepID=UPI0036AD7A3F